MKIHTKTVKACIISLVIWFPIYILYMLSTAHMMMVTKNTWLSYLVCSVFWGTVEVLPFLNLIRKSNSAKLRKAILGCAAVLASTLLLLLLPYIGEIIHNIK